MPQIRSFIARLAVIAVAAGLAGGLFAGVGFAHGAAVQVTPSKAGPGATITITGTGFEAGKQVMVTLESALSKTDLGTVTADAKESFTFTATVPASAGAGSYSVMCTNAAAGGDDETSGGLTVTAAASANTSSSSQTSMANSQPAAQPSSSQPTIVHQRTTAEDVVIGVLFGGLALIGLTLVLASRRHGSPGLPPI